MKYKIPTEFLQKGSFPLMPQRIFRQQQKLWLPLTLPTLRMKEIHDFSQYLLLYKPILENKWPTQLEA